LNIFNPETGDFRSISYSPQDNNSISSNVIKSIIEDNNGRVWLGTYSGGLTIFDRESNQFLHYKNNPNNPKSLADNNVWSIYEDRFGDIYLGLLNGFAKYVPQSNDFQNFFPDPENPKSLNDNKIIELFEDSQGNFWLGTINGGLNLFDREKQEFTHYIHDPSNANSLPSNEIRTITEDNNGVLWVGTSNGLCYLDNETMEFIKPEASKRFPNQVINGILDDDENNLWISSNKGLIKFNLLDSAISNYELDDGIQGLNFNYNASLKSKLTGEMYFGGVNGFNVFDPKKVLPNPNKPKTIITSLKVNSQNVHINQKINDREILKQSINLTDSITLSYKENIFSLSFASLEYSSPERNQYSYRLVNFDTTWNYKEGSENEVTYMNLEPETYVFEIKSSNNDGIWSDNTQQLTIIILPPWWETWWFRTFLGISIIVLALSFYKYRTHQLKRRNELLERKVNERTNELKQSQEQVLLQNQDLQEKQNEILTQNEELIQTQEELQTQRDYIDEKNKELQKINDNTKLGIEAAKEIQNAILPSTQVINQYFKDHFLLYKPRDIVSGDFYWIDQIEDDIWLVVADCTGHGVQGAFMTLLGKNFLDKIIKQDKLALPSLVLQELDKAVFTTLRQDETQSRRGMDLAILKFENFLNGGTKLKIAGSKNSVFIVDSNTGELAEYKGDKIDIGGHKSSEKVFTDREILLKQGIVIYAGTDGYHDQNNFDRKRFSKRKLKNLLASIANKPMTTQHEILESSLKEQMKNTSQRDDILLIGISI